MNGIINGYRGFESPLVAGTLRAAPGREIDAIIQVFPGIPDYY
jgi:hypothetical protein